MKIKDLIANRDNLSKYDELKEWKELFSADVVMLHFPYGALNNKCLFMPTITDNIKQIIINALQTEIDKLDEE